MPRPSARRCPFVGLLLTGLVLTPPALTSPSLAAEPPPVPAGFDLDRDVAWRRVEMDRWRFEPVFLANEAGDEHLAAVLLWRSRANDPAFTGLGGHDVTAGLYLLSPEARSLPVEYFGTVDAWPDSPAAVYWQENQSWAFDIVPVVFTMGVADVEDHTNIMSGFYRSPDEVQSPPRIAAFPGKGDPLLNAAAGDRAAARAALDDIVAFLRIRGGKPSVDTATADHFDGVPGDFVEVFPKAPWARVSRSEPVDGVCTCVYQQRQESLRYSARLDVTESVRGRRLEREGVVNKRPNADDSRWLIRTTWRAEEWRHEVDVTEPCPDAATVPDLVAASQHEQFVDERPPGD